MSEQTADIIILTGPDFCHSLLSPLSIQTCMYVFLLHNTTFNLIDIYSIVWTQKD